MKPKIMIFDTESSDLYATWGSLLCFTWMYSTETKPHIIRISDYPLFKTDPTNDRDLVRDIKIIMDKADMWFGWFSTKHDVPLINSRLIYHGLQILAEVSHIDGWRIAKDRLRLPRNSLAMASSFLEIEEKTPIKPAIWKRARAGHVPSLQYVYRHGLQDTLVTKQAYEKMLPLMSRHPNVYRIGDFKDGCPKCGVMGEIRKDGYGYAQKRAYPKYHCRACGGYTRGSNI